LNAAQKFAVDVGASISRRTLPATGICTG